MALGSDISTHTLDHLGLVAAVLDKIGLVKKIDERLPVDVSKGSKVSMGQRVMAMILNGLGFMDDRLYMFPDFLESKPVQRLFGPGICSEHFNDDALGRCLDAIYAYGATALFSEMAFEIGTRFGLLGKTVRLDTTSLTVYGEYAVESGDPLSHGPIHITHGYSQDGRPDLKQMILNLAITGKSHLPIWMSAHSGNASDKTILHQAAARIDRFTQGLKEAPSFIFVGDSALYEKCVLEGGDMLWLSRVPNSHKRAKEVLAMRDEDLDWSLDEKGYRLAPVLTGEHKGVCQRWVMVFSQQMYSREVAKLEKKIQKERASVEKALWHLGNQAFACAADGRKAVKKLENSLTYHRIHWEERMGPKHQGRGRPKAGAQPTSADYFMVCTLSEKKDVIQAAQDTKGRFILATN